MLVIEGPENPEIFEAIGPQNVGEAGHENDATDPAVDAFVRIAVDSWAPQPMDAADEFADTEDPVDYSINVSTVKLGSTVMWVNEDSLQHTATAVDGSFDSGFLDTDESWPHTFDKVGEFEYFSAPYRTSPR